MTARIDKKYNTLPAPRIKSKARFTADGFRAQQVCRPLKLTAFILAAVACGLAVPLLVMLDVRKDVQLAEWWTRNVQSAFTRVVGTLTSWIPFSVFEFAIVCLIGLAVFLFVRLVINLGRARFGRILVGVLSLAVAAVYVLDMYAVSMGFAYYRAEMPLPQSEKKYDAAQAGAVVEYFYNDYVRLAAEIERDQNGCAVCPYGFSELSDLLEKEYDKLGGYYNSYTPRAKPVVNSWFLSSMLITGITFLPTGEANVNNAAPPTERTATMAHEMAHAKGVMREGDANLLSWYVLVSSDNDYLRYCGYYEAFDNLHVALLLTGDNAAYREYGSEINALTYNEQKYSYEYWRSQPDLIGTIAEWFNNLYLKSNGAENGTGSYGDGNKSEVVVPINPDTGKPDTDPDTGEVIKEIHFSQVQKMFFAIYESSVT